MLISQLLWHLLSFSIPAIGVATLLTLFMKICHIVPLIGAFAVWLRITGIGLLALLIGWLIHQADGAMGSYLLMIVCQGGLSAYFSRH